jgi:hypothetical protein
VTLEPLSEKFKQDIAEKRRNQSDPEVLLMFGLQGGVRRLYWRRGAGMGQKWEIRAVKIWLLATIVSTVAVGIAQVNQPHTIRQPGLVLEYDRAISTLQRGIVLNWSDPQLYLHAFDRMSRTGTEGEPLTGEYDVVRRVLAAQLSSFAQASTVWDEQPPVRVRQMQRVQSALQSLSLAREVLLVVTEPPSASPSHSSR